MTQNNKTQTQTTPKSRDVTITKWRSHEKGSLRGFFSATFSNGFIINDLKLFDNADSRSIQLPQREYQGSDGKTKYAPIVELANEEITKRFQEAVLTALDRYFTEAAHGERQEQRA